MSLIHNNTGVLSFVLDYLFNKNRRVLFVCRCLIFKVRSAHLLGGQLIHSTTTISFCQELFSVFLKKFLRLPCPLSDSFIVILHLSPLVNTFFGFFYKLFLFAQYTTIYSGYIVFRTPLHNQQYAKRTSLRWFALGDTGVTTRR